MSKCFAFSEKSKNNEVISNYFLKPKTYTSDNQEQSVRGLAQEPVFTREVVQPLKETQEPACPRTEPFELDLKSVTEQIIEEHNEEKAIEQNLSKSPIFNKH